MSEATALYGGCMPVGTPPTVERFSPSILDIAAALRAIRDNQANLIHMLAGRRLRTLEEAVAVARLMLILPADQNHDLLVRVARFVLRLEGERAP
jgi:hypothetical protein